MHFHCLPLLSFVSSFLFLLPLSIASPPTADNTHIQAALLPESSPNPAHVLSSVPCVGSNVFAVPCCCHPPCSLTGSGCLSFISRGGNSSQGMTEAHFMSVDGSGHKYCCGNNCPQSNC